MPWMLCLFAFLSFVLLCSTKSVALGFICVLLTLGFMAAAVLQVISSRVGGSSRDSGRMLTPEELKAYREQAESLRAQVKAQSGPMTPTPDRAPPPDSRDAGPPEGQG